MASKEEESFEKDKNSDQVLDYYRKYSQNRNLPKYFSGTSVSYIPEIVQEEKTDDRRRSNTVELFDDDHDRKTISRASSAMSNKKLEWDNGADIGYSNVHKSSSLPDIKITECAESATSNNEEQDNIKIVIHKYSDDSDDSSDVPIEINIQSTSSESLPKEINPSQSTSKSSEECKSCKSFQSTSSEDKKIIRFADDLSCLKSKIGVPDAHSTPKYSEEDQIKPEIKDTPSTRKGGRRKIAEAKIREQTWGNRNPGGSAHKIVNLCITKPVLLQCEPKLVASCNKLVQTKLKLQSVSVQTESLRNEEIIITSTRSQTGNNQGIEYVEHETKINKKSFSTQTDSEVVVSNCESFEYIKTSTHLQDNTNITKEPTSPLKRHKTKPDLSNVQEDSSSLRDTSKDCPLGKLISADQTDKLVEDLERNFDLLQKLVKSKKYDGATKKRYIKKIITKIIELEDESASTSSELFFPKKSKEPFVPSAPKMQSSTESSDPKVQVNSLQNNIPWYPVQGKMPKKSNLEVKTFITTVAPSSTNTERGRRQSSKDEYSSQPEIIPIQSKPINKQFSKFTLTNNELYINHDSLIPENSNFGTRSAFVPIKSTNDTTSSSSKSYQNWKEDKTASERLHEERLRSSRGDILTDLAKQEREHQLCWINSEISYLKKLKHVLQDPIISNKEQIQPSKQVHVYSVSKKLDNVDLKRKYVIETDVGSARNGDIDFQLNGEVYNVHDAYSSRPTSSRLRGDIEVITDNSTTNIRVSTCCQGCDRRVCECQTCTRCKSSPCQCETKNCLYKNCSKCLENPCICCKRCGKITCICNVCSKCQRSVCVCLNLGLLKDSDSNESNPCECNKTSKLYLCSQCGTFNCNKSCGCSKKSPESNKVMSDKNSGGFKEQRKLDSAKASLNLRKDLVKTGSVVSDEFERTTARDTKDDYYKPLIRDIKDDYYELPAKSKDIKDDYYKQRDEKDNFYKTKNRKLYKKKGLQTSPIRYSEHYVQASASNKDRDSQTERSSIQGVGKNGTTSNKCENTQTDNIPVQSAIIQTKTPSIPYSDSFSSKTSDEAKSYATDVSGSFYLDHRFDSVKHCENVPVQTDYIPVQSVMTQTSRRGKSNVTSTTKTNGKFISEKPSDISETIQTTQIPAHSVKTQTKISYLFETKHSDYARTINTTDIEVLEGCTTDEQDWNTKNSANYKSNSSDDINKSYNDDSLEKESKTSSLSSICHCCKKSISERVAKVSQQLNRDNLSLCQQCLRSNPNLQQIRDNEGCICFSLVKTDMLRQLRKTINELHESFCACHSPGQTEDSNYCTYCQGKLQKTLKSRNGIAYTLTLVDKENSKKSGKTKPQGKMEEIKINVESAGKINKDKENKTRKDDRDSKSENAHVSGKKDCCDNNKQNYYTLQEYLCHNRPDFVDSADYRRKTVLNNKIEREKNSDEAKLRFLYEKQIPIKQNRLFSEKEMRDMTRRRYKQLPEVQNKLINQRRQQLHKASRLIVDTFNKKIQKNILKGKRDFPIDVNVVNLF